MSKNKIYLISFEFIPFSDGGLARHAKSVIDRLIKNKNCRAVIATPKNNKIRLQKDIITIPCTYFDNKYLCYLEFSLKVFFKFKNRFNIDSFVIFSSFSYFLVPVLPNKFYLFVHSNQKRVYFTKYDEESVKETLIRKFIYFFNYHWESYLCRKAKKIFSVSSSLKKDTCQQYDIDESKIIVVSNGVDTELFKKSYLKKYQRKNLLFVGKIFPRKNIVCLVNNFKLLIDNDPEFNLNIMGNGDNKYINKLKLKIDELKLGNKIFIHKYVSDYALNKLYEKSDLFVSTSLVEGFGLVLLEAMSKGLPVVAYENFGFSDIIINGENGYLIKQNDYDDFVNKILHLFKNEKIYQRMSINALKTIESFSWDTTVKKIVNEIK